MARRNRPEKRPTPPDARYNNVLVQVLINKLMTRGKKSTSERVIYGAFDIIEGKLKSDPLPIFKQALENVAPAIEVRSRRVGGATYQVPVEVRPERREALAIRWLIKAARA